jgi:hypothetical protein
MIPVVTTILVKEDNNFIKCCYTCKTDQASFCIADFGGNVIVRGNYADEMHLSLKELPKGMYTLCIIDGDELIKTRFSKDQ